MRQALWCLRIYGPLNSVQLVEYLPMPRTEAILSMSALYRLGYLWKLSGERYDVTEKGRRWCQESPAPRALFEPPPAGECEYAPGMPRL